MNNIETGGPAFPVVQKANAVSRGNGGGANYEMEQYGGTTLRDYFAAKAMEAVWKDVPEDVNRQQALQYLGESCYEMADAMIKARNQNA